jgi:hypothetical protein
VVPKATGSNPVIYPFMLSYILKLNRIDPKESSLMVEHWSPKPNARGSSPLFPVWSIAKW